MKRILTIFAAVLLTATIFAQAPEKMSYQAVVRDANNDLVTDTQVGMQISILQGAADGTAVYVETQTPTTNDNGLVSVEIGGGTVESGDFTTINWSAGPYFIKTETDPEGGTDYTITGTSQLLSSPYALYAKTAGDVTETDLADILTNGNDGGEKQIKNIADPKDDQDVVTLAYLDKYTHDGVTPSTLVLWNKLGSETEVLNSEVGENGELVGSGNNYEPAKFGNGYVRTDVNSYVKFPSSVLEARRTSGTIEFWVNPKVDQPSAYHYGAFMLVGYSINGSEAMAFVRWGDGVTGKGISGGVNFDGTLHRTPDESEQFVATVGTPFHIALVWDVNGIDGTTETVRVYRDGVVIGTCTESWNDNATTSYDHFYIGTGPDGEGYEKYIMDNIKVWNYAKTDFNDIDEESSSTPLFTAGDGIDITNNVISEHKYKVGDFAQGGIVFWVDETGEHGLVCAKSNQDGGSGVRWYAGTNTYTMAKGDGPYAGELNTAIIIANQGNGDGNTYAARICNELQITQNGITYGDWYLPSKQELNLMYQNKSTIDATAQANGGTAFTTDYYWSSTESNNDSAWIQDLSTGYQDANAKFINIFYVRAVRAF